MNCVYHSNAKRIDGLRRGGATYGCLLVGIKHLTVDDGKAVMAQTIVCLLWGLLCEGVALNLPQGTKFLDLYVFSMRNPNRYALP